MDVDARKQRNSSLELLRIVLMFLIVCSHYYSHGAFNFGSSFTLNKILMQILINGGNLGTTGFILISSYFTWNKTTIRFKSLISLFVEGTLISLIIALTMTFANQSSPNWKEWLKMAIPIFSGQWWFISTYFVFAFLTPFISSYLSIITKKQHLALLALLIGIWCLIPFFIVSSGVGMQLSNLNWFILLFCLVSYIQKYPSKLSDSKTIPLIFFFSALFVNITSVVAFNLLGSKWTIFSDNATYAMGRYSPFILIQGISLLCIFKNLKPFNSKVINLAARSMLGVYLIHEHPLIRPFLWQNIFKNSEFQNSPHLFVHFVVSVLIVFTACTFISITYNFAIDAPFRLLIDRFEASIQRKTKAS